MATGSIDPRAFREALGHYASGITIIGGIVDGAPVGFTCQSFYSVSIDPPLVSFGVMKTSTTWQKIRSIGDFSINILSSAQIELSNKFGRPSADRWKDVRWETSPLGTPVIVDALLCLDCSIYAEHGAGDHWLTIAHVNRLTQAAGGINHSPLLYYKGKYRQLAGA